MSLVNAAIRPSGASYRDRLFAKQINKNPSEIIDRLLEKNYGFLTFQEDTIAFLQQICGLTGSEADNIRRAIGRKQKDRLDAALPNILEGYCSKSDKPRDIAEKEARAFLQIIEDSSNYQFGYNHSTGYSMIGYLCAYLRYHYPLEFITSFLINAGNEDDILNGTKLAKQKGIKIHNPKFRYSESLYTIDRDTCTIYKGLNSIKGLNKNVGGLLWTLKDLQFNNFYELLKTMDNIKVGISNITMLTQIDFFSDFGKMKKLLNIISLFKEFHDKKQFNKDKIYSVKTSLIAECCENETEKLYKDFNEDKFFNKVLESLEDKDCSFIEKASWQMEHMGYSDIKNPNADPRLYMVSKIEQRGKTGNKIIELKNLSTGENSTAKVFAKAFKANEFKEGNILYIKRMFKEGVWKMTNGRFEQSCTQFENVIKDWSVNNNV